MIRAVVSPPGGRAAGRAVRWLRVTTAPVVATLALGVGAATAAAQRVAHVPDSLFRVVMPEASRFGEPGGDPPVIEGYRAGAAGAEELVGYVFLTSDLPPEQYGYSGPIEALVGMSLDGTLTGVRVTDYHESYMRQMGDFLHRRGFQEQFAGKYIGDPFRVWGDVDGISRVSISVRALSRGVRDAARRVAVVYGGAGTVVLPADPLTDVYGLSWFELRRLGAVERFEVTEPGEGTAGISLAYIGSDRAGEHFFGRVPYERALRSMERRGGAEHLMMYAVDGSRLRLFVREGWSIAQDGDTTAIDPTDIVFLGMPTEGLVASESTLTGVMLIKRPLDIRRPFTFIYDLGPALGVHTVQYTTQEARMIAAEDAAAAATGGAGAALAPSGETVATSVRPDAQAGGPPAADSVVAGVAAPDDPATDSLVGVGAGGAPSVGPELQPAGSSPDSSAPGRAAPVPGGSGEAPDAPGGVSGEGAEAAPAEAAASATAVAAPDASPDQEIDFTLFRDETLLQRLLADASWSRVAIMLLVLTIATWAFFAKSVRVRGISLVATLVLLGFVDGGFLSVSHITSGIWAGAGVFVRDLPLLMIVVFTVVTTLVWGRVFCGFLCPFGALQDVIDRVVPRRFQGVLPARVHDRAIYLKYGILAVIVLPAVAGSHVSLYQYFEPFGTVFFFSPSLLFWAIAVTYLLASAVVPRFYCRYACPLGAALGVVSLLSPRRIARAEQCDHCKVCEQKCPTRAIRGPDVDFKECVRCNVCEIQLLERRGVCRHEMSSVRPRLVELRDERGVGAR